MNAIEDMHEVRFSNIYILSHISYYIHPLTIIIALAIKTVEVFAIQYCNIKDWIWFFILIFYFRLKSLFLHVWRDEKKNMKTLNSFHILNILQKFFPLKTFHGCFLTHTKTARFVQPLIVLGRWGVSGELQTYPKNVLKYTNKTCKALEKGAKWI